MEYIDIATGEVKTGENGSKIIINALGSCVAVVGYNIRTGMGGAAHVMLPGIFRSNPNQKDTRYARDAVKTLLKKLNPTGREGKYLRISLIGGADVLNHSNDSIGRDNITSIKAEIRRWNIIPDVEITGEKFDEG